MIILMTMVTRTTLIMHDSDFLEHNGDEDKDHKGNLPHDILSEMWAI